MTIAASHTGREREYVVAVYDDVEGDCSHYVSALDARAALRAAMRRHGWRASGAYQDRHDAGYVPMTIVQCGRGRQMRAHAFHG